MEPEPERERDTPSRREADQAWSPYDELAAREEAEWRRSRRRRSRRIFGVGLLVMCLVGSIAGYFWYDRTTRVDRSTPVIVVFEFINAIFDARDFERAASFECASKGASDNLRDLLADFEELERQFNIHVSVSPTNFRADIRGSNAVVAATLLIDVPESDGAPSRSSQRWIFDLRDEDGWHVCEAKREQ